MSEAKNKKKDEVAMKRKIFRITKRMIKERGYAKVSTNHIAKEAGVSIGYIYKLFEKKDSDASGKPSIRQFPVLKGKPAIIHELIMNSSFIRGFTSIKKEQIKVGFENMQKLSGDDAREKISEIFLLFIEFHRRKKSIITALEIAYLSEKKMFKNFDFDYFYKDLIDTISSLLVFIGKENDAQLSKLLFNTFNNIVIRHVIFGKITETDEQLAEFLSDLLISYIKSIGGDILFE